MRRILLAIVALVATGTALFVWWGIVTSRHTYRFRLAIEVETPAGLKTGSSVIEIRLADDRGAWLPEARKVHSYVHGEAVFVDLGSGRNVTGLLGFGPTGNDDRIATLVDSAFQPSHPGLTFKDVPQLKGTAPLTGELVPTLVTFTDLNNPKTARVVRPDAFERVFGPRVRFESAHVEMVPAGWWPFNVLGWPSSLAGVPVTRGIEKKLPWWNLGGRPAEQAYRAWLAGQTTGPSIAPEILFKRN